MTRYPDSELERDLRWWAAANYLTVAQIYLQDNVLLREPLSAAHIKPRLLGHWGTSPGLSMIYTLLNRLIRRTDTDCLYVTGPGHGGPALVANTYLEGSYSEVYPRISTDTAGLRNLVRQFSTPGGIPSHVSVQTPGSIHEGGELGYALVHAAAPPSTTRTCWWPASSATVRPRQARSPHRGSCRPFSTRAAMAPCCRSCT